MRWRFIDPSNREETAERAGTIMKIDSWWREFREKWDQVQAVFARKSDFDLAAWMEAHLQAIDPRLMWEFGPAVHGSGHRLVITPESHHHLRPLVARILERAPAVEGWEFYEYRLPEDIATTRLTVDGRTGGDIRDFKVRVERGEHHRIHLCYSSPSVSDANDQIALNAAFVATETLLGEECLNKWIGGIEVSPQAGNRGSGSLSRHGDQESPRFYPLERLKETVEAVISSIRDQLPQRPHWEWIEEARWTLWELQPASDGDEYIGQADLIIGKSADPSMWLAAHSDALFFSERFSRCGETFCYVKIDGSEGLAADGFADKSEIEDALDAVLKSTRLGCHIGGGTGLRYSYIDLAVTDLDRAIAAIRQRLQAGNVPRRSWIQLFDASLDAEWVGIFEETPPPPMAPFDA
jgi:hypothetical protein